MILVLMRAYSRYTYTQIVHMRDVNVTCGQHLHLNVQHSDRLEGWDAVVQDVLALGDADGGKCRFNLFSCLLFF